MKRRKFLRSSIATGVVATVNPAMYAPNNQDEKEVYELREYEMRFGADQSKLETYFKKALIPALNKYGIKNVGVFTDWSRPEPAKFFLLIPYSSMNAYISVQTKVKNDTDYLKNSAEYNSVPVDKALYSRFTSSLMLAFDGFPKLVVPTGASRIIELRTYEGYSEDAVRRKIKMFNDGEFPIFKRAKLESIFYGEVIAGDKLPRLTYMLSVGSSMEERDKGWAAFLADPEWKKLVADPQYANTISSIIKTFLVPTTYSQI